MTRQTKKFFLIGLSISLAIVITAFEWRTLKENPKPRVYNPQEAQIDWIIPITNFEIPPTPQPILKQIESKAITVSVGEITEVGNDKSVIEMPPIDMGSTENRPFVPATPESENEESTDIFIFLEQKPEPKDGLTNFYKSLSKNLKYPQQARRIGTEGKVYVEFIVNRNGELADLKVIKGIGSGCDEEAMRVLALTKWEPGKQRGRPVRVKMVLPISFQLSH